MLLNDLDLQKLKDGSYKTDPYLSRLNPSDIIAELVDRSKPPVLESPYIELDDIEHLLNKVKELVPKSKCKLFDDISDQILANLENQRDYLMGNYEEYKKWMKD